jgi:hypothetical protein
VNFKIITVAVLVWLSTVAIGRAATLNASGATAVVVDGSLYDVTFADGTCVSLYNGCDSSSDFLFSTLQEANAASLALLNLFNKPENEAYTNDFNLTTGCSNYLGCLFITPYALGIGSAGPNISLSAYYNLAPPNADFVSDGVFGRSTDTVVGFLYECDPVNAVWTPPAANIPLPTSFLLLSASLAWLAGMRLKTVRASPV